MLHSHMGLGPADEQRFYQTKNSFLHGWLVLAVLFTILIATVIASTPARAWAPECPWPCFDKPEKPKYATKWHTLRAKARHKRHRASLVRKTQKRVSRAAKSTKRAHGATTRPHGFGVGPRMVKALVRQESGGHCCRRSRAGALGKYQIMPRTARKWARASGHSYLRRASYRKLKRALYTPEISRDIARTYINYYKRKYGHDELVLIAYNGGPKRARQANYCLKRYGYLCVYRWETYKYVKNIFRMAGRKPMKIVCKCKRWRRRS